MAAPKANKACMSTLFDGLYFLIDKLCCRPALSNVLNAIVDCLLMYTVIPMRLVYVQLKEEEERIEEGEADTRKKLKAMRDHNKEWEGTRETRVSRHSSLTS